MRHVNRQLDDKTEKEREFERKVQRILTVVFTLVVIGTAVWLVHGLSQYDGEVTQRPDTPRAPN